MLQQCGKLKHSAKLLARNEIMMNYNEIVYDGTIIPLTFYLLVIFKHQSKFGYKENPLLMLHDTKQFPFGRRTMLLLLSGWQSSGCGPE